MEALSITSQLKSKAQSLGFQLSGVCPAVTPSGLARFGEWIESGYAGQMHYLPDRAEAYEHPRHVLDGARSILMLGMNYDSSEAAEPQPGQGRIARYAWGSVDYHDLIHQRLKELAEFLRNLAPDTQVRGVVDTAPLLEREFAQLSGLGWVGKNTLLLNREVGSWFFLAALLTDLELDYDQPHETDHCGTCRACLDACPTDAFPQPFVLDATRCISYLTIELREMIPMDLREGLGDWLFGCDVCQEVCPWNRHAPEVVEPGLMPVAEMAPIDAAGLFALDDDAFRRRFRKTPLWRSKRRGILRNAAIVLGNRPSPAGLEALLRGLIDFEPLVRAASAWALGHYVTKRARDALQARSLDEQESTVIIEIEAALNR